jgi:glycosyltransferase involved in cell wall biosynthesis
MNIHVNFFCHFNETGVGRHCENAFYAMSRNRPNGLYPMYIDNTRESSVHRAIDDGRVDTDITAFFWRYPARLVQQFRGPRLIWWFFESDRLPRKWLDEIQVYDEIWVPSGWARDVVLAHDVPPSRVRLMESGVKTTIFRPTPVSHDGFVFLMVGKYEKRKSIDETVIAFEDEFPAAGYPHVQLWLKADFPLFPDRVHELARKVIHDRRIRVISGRISDEQMARLYCASDAFVSPSKAEGFGLPCIEAIACGVPVIATNVTAQSVFLDRIPGLYAPVAFELAPIVDDDYRRFYAADYQGEDFGNWAIPSVESLRSAMRDVYEDPESWRERAHRAAALIREEFSWDAIARRAIAAVQQLKSRSPVQIDPIDAC